jgi:two-component system, OmpR family, KDP operon response regulator KdpE
MCACVLIIEDDGELRRFLQIDLVQHGYQVITAADGVEGLHLFEKSNPDLVVLDVALPEMDGYEVCQKVRTQSDIPILMMTAHAVSEEEIARGLDTGADEYMLKPMGNIEFHARIRALLRRAAAFRYPEAPPYIYEDDHLSVNLNTRRVRVAQNEIRLTPTEFSLLATFIRHDDQVLTFQQILEQVWGAEYRNEHHYPRIYVSHLRRKIEPDFKKPTYIHNEYGVGYRFIAQNRR